MKIKNITLLAILIALFTISCTEEEPEYCSCSTTVYDEFNNLISKENSAEETPPDGNCYSLNYSNVNQENGYSTWKLCN